MKMSRWLLMAVFCTFSVFSCFDPPEYPDQPEIVFKSVNFVEVPDLPSGEAMADSVILVLTFKDGDGNLGLSTSETDPPYNDRWYYVKRPLDGALSPECAPFQAEHRCHFYDKNLKGEFEKYVDYSNKQKGVAPYDTLRDFVKPYNCTRWEIVRDGNGQVIDSLYFTLNPHHNNIFVEFQTKNGFNQNDPEYPYVPFNWSNFLNYPSCEVQGFNGRFPLLSEPGSTETPLEGEIRYGMPSPFFKVIFGSTTLRLKVYIEDRDLNKSNVIYTNDFNF